MKVGGFGWTCHRHRLNPEAPRVVLRRAGGCGGGTDLAEQRGLHAGGVGAVVDAEHLPCL